MCEFRTFDLFIGRWKVKQSKQKAELGFFSAATQEDCFGLRNNSLNS